MKISLTVTDTLHYTPSIRAINKTLGVIGDKISNIHWFSDIDYPDEKVIDVNWVKIPKMTDINEDYNYVTLKLCPEMCTEDFNLIVQSDGYAVNRSAWTDEFFEYDYIGAAWQDGFVGNGGFSLRSKKLYKALLQLGVEYKSSNYEHLFNNSFYSVFNGKKWLIPEDNIICKIHRDVLINDFGIKFAPVGLANQFSVEHYQTPWKGRSLGFHGRHGIAEYYNETI